MPRWPDSVQPEFPDSPDVVIARKVRDIEDRQAAQIRAARMRALTSMLLVLVGLATATVGCFLWCLAAGLTALGIGLMTIGIALGLDR